MPVTSNITEISQIVDGLGHVLDMDRSGNGGRLGDLMADIVAANIQARTLEQQRGPDGGAILANRGKYGQRKRSRGIKVGVGLYGRDEVGGEMLELDQVRGMVQIGEGEVIMEYGLDAENKDKAAWFTDGNPKTGQPPRPFYELDDDICNQLLELCGEFAESGIRDMGGV